MENKCNCYVEERHLTHYTVPRNPNYKTVSRCYGTKEREECSCGGDETKCNFYPEKRAAAQARKATEDLDKNKKYTYEETKEQFLMAWNTNAYINMCESSDMENAIKALDKQIARKPIVGIQSFLKCACCHSVVRTTDNYCHECGQMLDWTD